eukprot:CAMPEP_0183339844 /NCGR_PEP_ID=MMETSP0164_2-20130417/6625_1 /TAXON_ID=221442 /ORGANISM="Coccolithus pelagicus ssp braarudi, Strain PLY182g" /LENGTH=58 /DNA_ID=CAMNT_0025509909 /DNA_START=58 /DNA_END=234 /DNA_ORIENTATION=+
MLRCRGFESLLPFGRPGALLTAPALSPVTFRFPAALLLISGPPAALLLPGPPSPGPWR